MPVMAFACARMAGSAAGGGWENCYLVGEHMHTAAVPVKELYKSVKFLPSA
jgi:hypothetical protein